MKRVACWALVASAACGPGLPPENPKERGRNALAEASGNEQAIRQLLLGSVTYAGLWFPDSECVTQFPVAAPIPADHLDAFAHCLATLHWQPSNRSEQLADVVVLTYPPGIEIEARVVPELSGPRITWIGFVSRRDESSAPPSITPEAFDTLRTAGDRNGPLDAAVAPTLELDHDFSKHAYTWFQVCLDSEGKVTGIHARKETSQAAARAFADAASRWTFRPFTMGGQAIPVCSLIRMAYPADPPTADDNILPLPRPPSADVLLAKDFIELPAKVLQGHRISGQTIIQPDDQTRVAIQQRHIRAVAVMFRICLNAHGHVESIDLLHSSGFATYDRELARAIRSWVYTPYVVDDKPVQACSAVTFIYHQ